MQSLTKAQCRFYFSGMTLSQQNPLWLSLKAADKHVKNEDRQLQHED